MIEISPRLRREAAAYCSLMAEWFLPQYSCMDLPDRISKATDLGQEAYFFASTYCLAGALSFLEAEALLRTGWTP